MKIGELNHVDADTFRYYLRDFHGCVPAEVSFPLTNQQYYLLRGHNIVLDPEGEILKIDHSGMLRKCVHGIPCSYECNGLYKGTCTRQRLPSCNIPDGACFTTKKACCKSCDSVPSQVDDQLLLKF